MAHVNKAIELLFWVVSADYIFLFLLGLLHIFTAVDLHELRLERLYLEVFWEVHQVELAVLVQNFNFADIVLQVELVLSDPLLQLFF